MTDKSSILYLGTRALPLERTAEIKAGQDAGIEIIMAAPSLEPYREYNLSHFLEAPVTRHEEARKIILDYVRTSGLKVQGLVAWSEHQVELIAQLGVDMGLPALSPEAACNVRSKANTRRVLEPLDGVNPRYAIVRDESSFKVALETVGVPCLLKPAGSSGGRGIFKIRNYEQALSIFREFKEYCDPQRDEVYSYFNQEIVLEQELIGSEHSVSGMVADGKIVVFAITDKKIDPSVPIQYQNATPSALPQEIQQQIVGIAQEAVKLTGINWCGFHIDLMVTAEGPKILEIGGRLGGECINSHLIPLSRPSINPYQLLLQVVQGINPFTKDNYIDDVTNRSALRILLPPGTGRILRLDGLDQVRQHPNVKDFLQLRSLGDEVVLPSVKFYGYELGHVIAQCAIEDDMEAILEEIASLVTVEVGPS
jgi:hypothetical protein